MATSYTHTTSAVDTTEIVYDRVTRDYAIYDAGRIVGYGRSYHDAEQKRTEYLAERDETLNVCAGWGCVDGCADCQITA